MTWPTMSPWRDSTTREAWGHVFQWTPDHQTPEQYDHLKHTCDTLGEECATILNEDYPSETPPPSSQELQSGLKDSSAGGEKSNAPPPQPKRDLYILLREHHHENEKLQQLWDEVNTIPTWVDWDQIARGQDVFNRYGVAAITGLTYQSLLGGTGSSRAAEVLARTGGFSMKAVWRRLLETTQYVLECTNDLTSIKPGGDGFASCIRVRFLHATVRHRILRLTSTRPSYFSVEKYGVPINDLDCIGTIAVFSATVIWQSLPRQGIFPRKQEILDYLALWRLIAYYMGTPSDFFSTPAKAKAIMESLYLYEYTPSATSKLHARNIIRAMENTPPAYASRSYLEANARWLNGNPLADALELGPSSVYNRALIVGQCIIYMTVCYISRAIPFLDRYQINIFRGAIWSLVRSKEWGLRNPTAFDFKFVPGYGVHTKDEGDVEERKPEVFWTADRKSLATLLVAGGFTFLWMWAWGKAAFWFWGRYTEGSHMFKLDWFR